MRAHHRRLDAAGSGSFNMKFVIFRTVLGLAGAVLLAGNAAGAESISGLWKWTFTTQSGDTIESSARLSQEGEKVTGVVNSRFGETEISEGSVKEEDVRFQIKRERDGQAFVINYAGKVSGDKITGKMDFQRDGETRSRDWEAKRQTVKVSAAGTWNIALQLENGERYDAALRLKQDGERLTGAAIREGKESAILDGKVAGDEISFKVLREREGRTVTGRFKGKISGDAVKGKVEMDLTGEWQTLDWEGTRGK